jgi:hypothetical protein
MPPEQQLLPSGTVGALLKVGQDPRADARDIDD